MAGVIRYAGVDLSTLGVGMRVLDGVYSLAPVRGANLVIPYQTGQRWTAKFVDERMVLLQGTIASTTAAALETKIDQLKGLFVVAAGEQALEVQRGDGTFRYLMAEVRNLILPIDASRAGRSVTVSIELVASDPNWYSSALEASQTRPPWTFDSGVFFDDGHFFDQTSALFARLLAGPTALVEASNSGTAPVRKVILNLQGAMLNPTITNLRNGVGLSIARAFTGADRLVIDAGLQQVIINDAPRGVVVTLAPGASDWLRLEPGENTLKIQTNQAAPVQYSAVYSAAYL